MAEQNQAPPITFPAGMSETSARAMLMEATAAVLAVPVLYQQPSGNVISTPSGQQASVVMNVDFALNLAEQVAVRVAHRASALLAPVAVNGRKAKGDS